MPFPWWLHPDWSSLSKYSSSSGQRSPLSPLSLSWSAGGCSASGTSMFASRSIPQNPVRQVSETEAVTSTYQVHTSTNTVRIQYILVCTVYVLSTYSVQGYAWGIPRLWRQSNCDSVNFGVQALCILGVAHCWITPHAIVQYSLVLLCTGTYLLVMHVTIQRISTFQFGTWYIQICTGIRCTNAAMCQLSTYLFSVLMKQCPNWVRTCLYLELQNFYKYVTVCTWSVLGMYSVRTQYVLRTTKQMCTNLKFKLWISCIASCTLYHYATSVHSMVLSTVNTRYLTTGNYSRVARYLLAGVGRPAWVQPRPRLLPWRHWSKFKFTWESASHCQVPSLFTRLRVGAWAGYDPRSARQIQVHPTMPFSVLRAGLLEIMFFHFGACPGEFVARVGPSPCSALCT